MIDSEVSPDRSQEHDTEMELESPEDLDNLPAASPVDRSEHVMEDSDVDMASERNATSVESGPRMTGVLVTKYDSR